jgi:hypothetical protein
MIWESALEADAAVEKHVRDLPGLPDAPPRRQGSATPTVELKGPLRIRVSSTIGICPLLVSYSVVLHRPERLKGAYFLWLDNGEQRPEAADHRRQPQARGAGHYRRRPGVPGQRDRYRP